MLRVSPAPALPAAWWSPTAARTHTSCSACQDTEQRGMSQVLPHAPSTCQELHEPLGSWAVPGHAAPQAGDRSLQTTL